MLQGKRPEFDAGSSSDLAPLQARLGYRHESLAHLIYRFLVTPDLYVDTMRRGDAHRPGGPIVIPRLESPESASADERDEHLMLLEAARHALEVEWTGTLAAADAASDHDVFGHPLTVAYLKARLGLIAGRAHRYVKIARAARSFKATFSAWRHRQISSDQAELLLRAAEKAPDAYSEAEGVLLEIVGDDVTETRQVLDYWQHEIDRGPKLDLEAQLERRRLDVKRLQNGMVSGDFALPELAGETLLAALTTLMPPPAGDDARTADQRRADALEDLARCFLDGSSSPEVGGERAHLNVHVDLDAVNGLPGGLHETEDGHILDLETIRQISCDSSVSRIVFGPSSEVLDVGRKTRVIPAALRRAVVARDRHCVAPGCTRSASWCDVHHILPWAEGGETALDNLCLLCRYHHTLVHLEIIDLSRAAGRQRIGARSPPST